MYRPRIYTASNTRHAAFWRSLRLDPNWHFAQFTARWPDHPTLDSDGDLTAEQWSICWQEDRADVLRSDFVLLFRAYDDKLRGALVEAGMALGAGLQVIAVNIPEDHSWTYHPNVTRCSTLVEARNYAYKFAIMAPPRRKGEHPDD